MYIDVVYIDIVYMNTGIIVNMPWNAEAHI